MAVGYQKSNPALLFTYPNSFNTFRVYYSELFAVVGRLRLKRVWSQRSESELFSSWERKEAR